MASSIFQDAECGQNVLKNLGKLKNENELRKNKNSLLNKKISTLNLENEKISTLNLENKKISTLNLEYEKINTQNNLNLTEKTANLIE